MKRLILLALVSVGLHAQEVPWVNTVFLSNTVATPVFSPATPYTGGNTTVTIATSTGGAALLYCTVSSGNCYPSTTYTGGISFTSTENICAMGTFSGYNNSAIACWQGTYGLNPQYIVGSYFSNGSSGQAGTPGTVTFTCVGGEFVPFASFDNYHNATVFTPSATNGNTVTKYGSVYSDGTMTLQLMAVATCNAGPTTVTVANNAGGFGTQFIAGARYLGLLSHALDVLGVGASGGSGTTVSCSITPTLANELVINFVGLFSASGSGSVTPSGFVIRSQATGNPYQYSDNTTNPASSVTAVATFGSTGDSICRAVAFD